MDFNIGNDIKLIKGNSRELINDLPDTSIDMVITDPPYGIGYDYLSRRNLGHKTIIGDCDSSRFAVLQNIERVMKQDSVAAVFTCWKTVADDIDFFKRFTTLDLKNVIIWHKNRGSVGDTQATFSTDYEIILILHKGRCKLNTKRIGSVWNYSPIHSSKRIHPNQKPVDLLEQLMESFSKPGDLVLDPFAGSASTAIAAMTLCRRFIGFELDESFYLDACNRLRNEYNENGGWVVPE